MTDTEPECDALRELSEAHQQLVDCFASSLDGAKRAAVAFSGGVDSSLVLALMVRCLGASNVVAVLGVSPSLALSERTGAHAVARAIGADLVEVQTEEMSNPDYVRNDADRCYFCKHELYTVSYSEVVEATGVEILVNGDTADDVRSDDRPGMRAATELHVLSPLALAGIGKGDVRELARALALPVWDKPSSPCLASRIPRAVPVTIGRLSKVEAAEAALRQLGLREVRVRHGEPVARVELGTVEHDLARRAGFRTRVIAAVRSAGYEQAEIAPHPLIRS